MKRFSSIVFLLSLSLNSYGADFRFKPQQLTVLREALQGAETSAECETSKLPAIQWLTSKIKERRELTLGSLKFASRETTWVQWNEGPHLVFIEALLGSCKEANQVWVWLNWVTEQKVPVKASRLVLGKAEGPLAEAYSKLLSFPSDSSVIETFAKDWLKLDQTLEVSKEALTWKKAVQKAAGDLKGIVSLKKWNELAKIKTVLSVGQEKLLSQVADEAQDLKTLRALLDSVRRGKWSDTEKILSTFSATYTLKSEIRQAFSEGRKAIDKLIPMLEAEIDLFEKKLKDDAQVFMESVLARKMALTRNIPHPNIYVQMLPEYSGWIYLEEEALSLKGRWAHCFSDPTLPLDLEIGCGNGLFFHHQAKIRPERNLLGIEIKYKPLVQTVRRARKEQLPNARGLRFHARLIHEIFNPAELNNVYVQFPDPWPRVKQQKNRLLQTSFLQSLHTLQRSGSFLDFKTDSLDYFESVQKIISQTPYRLDRLTYDLHRSDWAHENFVTAFERIFISKGQPIFSMRLQA